MRPMCPENAPALIGISRERMSGRVIRTVGQRLKPLLTAALAALAVGLIASACGGSGGGGGDGDDSGGQPVAYDVSMGDNVFGSDELTVNAGDTVTFNLANDGIAIHNMRIAGADGDYNTDDDVVSEPAQFAGGDTGSLVWNVPDQAGTVAFQCDFHPIEMVGTVIVQ